jgi:hypothetical protein
MKDTSSSKVPKIQELAKAAKPLVATDIDKYFKGRVVAKRSLATLKASSLQLGDSDKELTSSLRDLRTCLCLGFRK